MKHSKIAGLVLLGVMAAGVTTGCEAFNPATTASYAADQSAGATQQILHLYPSATGITMHEASDNPDYMSWNVGRYHCEVQSSAVNVRGDTSGSIIGTPYCIEPGVTATP